MLGAEQEAWLGERLGDGTGTWNVLGQQVSARPTCVSARCSTTTSGTATGRPAIACCALGDAQVPIAVVLTGDIHLAGVGIASCPGCRRRIGHDVDLVGRQRRPRLQPSSTVPDIVDAELAHRGWIMHTVTPGAGQAEYRIVDDVLDPTSPVTPWRTFHVDATTRDLPVVE